MKIGCFGCFRLSNYIELKDTPEKYNILEAAGKPLPSLSRITVLEK